MHPNEVHPNEAQQNNEYLNEKRQRNVMSNSDFSSKNESYFGVFLI